MQSQYDFTTSWFDDVARSTWDGLIPRYNPTRILEIGSYEGASTTYLIEKLGSYHDLDIHCVDTWEGAVEHLADGNWASDMPAVEQRFFHNTELAISHAAKQVALTVHKQFSDVALATLLAEGKQGYFDFVYIDGSHMASDVLCDAVLGFRLLKNSGLLIFDDYLWQEHLPYGIDPVRSPKIAIDAFSNIYCRKIRIEQAPLYQLYVQKISD